MATKTLEMMPQDQLANVDWHCPIQLSLEDGFLPNGGTLYLTENGVKIPVQVQSRNKWASNATANAHGYARTQYNRSFPRTYQIHNADPGGAAPTAGTLTITDQTTHYLVRNGFYEFTLSKATFRGPEAVRVDPTGLGAYAVNTPPSAALGPVYEDDRGIIYQPGTTSLTIVEQGTVAAVFKSLGFMRPTNGAALSGGQNVDPWIEYATFITVYASGRIIWFQNRFTFMDDARTHRYKEFVYRLSKQPGMEFFLRNDGDIDPHTMAELSNSVTNLEVWRRGGYPKKKTTRKNWHTMPWLRGGEYMYLHPDDEAFAAVEEAQKQNPGEWTETDPVHLRTSNMQGTQIEHEFCMMLVPRGEEKRMKKLLQQKPMVKTPGTQYASSLVQGPIASRVLTGEYAPFEEWLDQVWLGFFNPDASNDYGWCCFGNAHESLTEEAVDNDDGKPIPGSKRPSAHRQPYVTHYGIHQLWIHFMRGAGQDILDTVRAATRYARQFVICNYSWPRPSDGWPTIREHYWRGFYHGKAGLPWGTSDWGMHFAGGDTENALTGHFPDPTMAQFDFLYDCNWIAKEQYDAFLAAVNWAQASWGREANMTQLHAFQAWKYTGITGPRGTWHRDGAINRATALISKPLADQQSEGYIATLANVNWPVESHEILVAASHASASAANTFVIDSAAAATGILWDDYTTASLIAGAVARGQSAALLNRFEAVLHPGDLRARTGPGPIEDRSALPFIGERHWTLAWPRVAKVKGFV